MKPTYWSLPFALVSIVIMVVLIIMLEIFKIPGTMISPVILEILDTLFIGLVCLTSIIIISRSYCTSGSWTNLILGGALLAFALDNYLVILRG